MRYHFNIREGTEVISDEEGSEFPNLMAARAEARASLRDLAGEDIRSGRPAHAWRVEIATHGGTVLHTVGARYSEN